MVANDFKKISNSIVWPSRLLTTAGHCHGLPKENMCRTVKVVTFWLQAKNCGGF